VVGAVTLGAMSVAVETLLAREKAVERGEQILVGSGPDLDDHHARRGVRNEDREEAVACVCHLRDEARAIAREIDQAAPGSGPDGQLARLYGKMLRSASRSRPSPPPAGADS
jgi:hypothetical protein